MASVDIQIDEAALRKHIEPAMRAARQLVAKSIQQELLEADAIWTRELIDSVTVTDDAVVSEVTHAAWIERGTGIYRVGPGPKRPITPTRGKYLRFQIHKGPDAGKIVFARSVRGIEPRHAFKNGAKRVATKMRWHWIEKPPV